MFEWRVYENLSREAIALRLDAGGAPSPDGEGWHPTAVGKILANPKYTGYMVYGRTRNTGKSQRAGERKVRAVPPEEWTWSAQPSHPALYPGSYGRPRNWWPPTTRGSGTRKCRPPEAAAATRCGPGCVTTSAATG